ncbi:hypothetical protein [Emcibacter sp. SYSU 3D8]|uniref:hypothetical protein n=1 Tax=Emcibacter sp. SYSU 3D8 TaxID=3133969 RepID=UPI0031FEEF2A
MLRSSLTAAAVIAATAITSAMPAHAVPGHATPRLEIKAGPDDGYPTVATVRYDTRLEINGCLRNWRWCDVSTSRTRGWVHGRDIQVDRGGRRLDWGTPWGVPQSDFDFDSYWDRNYRGQEFYRQRNRWERFDPDDEDVRPISGGMGPGDRDGRWRQRYSRSYSYNDDVYYRDCRSKSDPAGIIAGGLIGGLIGKGASGRRGGTGATIAGVIVGGTAGAALTRRMECEDRSYAYKTYSQALNSGRANSNWQWENPETDNYGDFRVNQYYDDPDGFRCATFTQQVYVNDRGELVNGRACRQPDGSWVIVQ